jgi:hypothetical protein
VVTKESNVLRVPHDEMEIQAGIKNFDKFAEFNVIYSLSGGDVTKYNAVFNLEYNEAFITLYRKAEEARYTSKLNKIISAQHKK